MKFHTIFLIIIGLLTTSSHSESTISYGDTDKGIAFINAQSSNKNTFDQNKLLSLFSSIYPDQSILDRMSKPAEKTMPWHQYRNIFLDQKRIDNGRLFMAENREILKEAYDIYGVPPSIIVAILGVETRYGKVMGNDQVIRSLATLAFDFPSRSPFFTKELESFLVMTKQYHLDPLELKGSYAGAMGMAQFMPSSYLHYAVDYDKDGRIDLWENKGDAIFSVANYLKENGWQRGGLIVEEAILIDPEPVNEDHKPFISLLELKAKGILPIADIEGNELVGYLRLEKEDGYADYISFNNFKTITTYNTSPLYAMAVFELANQLDQN